MEVITGDETGLIKVIDVSKREFLTYGSQDRNSSVEALSWLTNGYGQKDFAILRANSNLEAWRYEPGQISMLTSISLPSMVSPLSVSLIEANRVVCVGKAGDVSIVRLNDRNSASESTRKKEDKSLNWDILGSFQVKGPVGACATCNGGAAFGGSENDVVLYDTMTQQSTWSARNVPYDSLRLKVPIWIAAISFLHPSEDTPSSAQFVTGTGYKHIRLYDIKASQQPLFSIDIGGEYRITSVQPTGDGNALFVGDCSGGLAMWDLRMSKRKVSVLKGSSGSIRSIHMTTSGNRMATVGLDRFLRVYDTSKTHSTKVDSMSGNNKIDCSSKLICSAYLKNRLNCCILADSESKLPKKKRSRKQGEVGDDDILNKNVNFDSDDDDDDEKDDESNDDCRESGSDEENFDEDSNEEEEDGDDSNEENDDNDDNDDEEEDEVEAHKDDESDSNSDESDEELDKKEKKWKGQGDNEFSSRKQRVAAVARSDKSKQKINDSQKSRNKKRKI